MGEEGRKLSSGWYKWEIVGKICAGIVIPIAVVLISYFYSDYLKEKEIINSDAAKEKEIQTRYIEIASQILQQKPDESNKGVRLWAIEILKRYSPILISPQVEKELQKQPLYKSVNASTEFSARPGFKTNATVTHGNKSQEKNLSEQKSSAGITVESDVIPGNKNPQDKNLPEQQKP
jgi:hypothetical protein